ncbi:MAG: MIP/aquaporin family protein [Ilumatobacter sp.]|uniref:MIP/aquaporin family protein n=1 Tax=Ilumatobacter sp. TaxID=1967498 RepID=UPI00391B699E
MPSDTRNLVTELVGTLVVMLAGPGVLVLSDGRVTDLGAAVAFGAGLALAIGVIGAVANPAFTLALLLVREISPRNAVSDWIGQLAGGVLGAAIIWAINDQTRVAVGSNGWDRGGYRELGSVIAAELVFSVIIVVVLLSTISQGYSTAAIASFTATAYALGHLVLIGLDGGGLNPARSIGSAIFSDADPSPLGQLWVFVVVPLVGAGAAVFVWLLIDDAEIDDTLFDDTLIDRD